MTDDLIQRGQALFRRRLRHGFRSVSELAAQAGMDRKTIARVERGTASPVSAQELKEFYDRLDAEKGIDTSAEEEHSEDVRFEVSGPRTEWKVVVSGPADIADVLRQQVVELLREVDPED